MSSNDVTKRWYLRTHVDGDTHRGILADTGLVTADCGIHFPPQRLAIAQRTNRSSGQVMKHRSPQ